jgi:hypothetical protein
MDKSTTWHQHRRTQTWIRISTRREAGKQQSTLYLGGPVDDGRDEAARPAPVGDEVHRAASGLPGLSAGQAGRGRKAGPAGG